ncbi:MAG: FMN-binding protein [Bacteroidales bacterium]|nr:FMN-binding protein [Bacteroidales bacterium]
MKKIILALTFAFALLPAMAQEHNCANCPHHKQHQQSASCCEPKQKMINGLPAEIANAFPTAKSIKKDTQWTLVYNAKKELLGYVVYSKPASNGIKGYAGETPLMIALGSNMKILSVTMLQNNETPSYLSLVVNSGLLKSWNGMKVSRAKKKNVDTVAGATFSSRSIIQTFQAAIKKL